MSVSARSFQYGIFLLLLLGQSQAAYAFDSYRWLTVSINTPWMIFVFLLPLVMVPLILMAIMHWRFAKPDEADESADNDNNPNRQ
jgi:hypothetical protein